MTDKPFIVSDESINSYGFNLKSAGGNFTQFLKNPVMLYDHNDTKLPIGTWSDLQVHDNGTITAVPEFDEDDEFAMKVKKKVEKGIIRMSSVSALPLEIEGKAVTKWELREISITPFGGNKNAFRLYDNKGNTIDLSNKEGVLKLKEQVNILNLNNNNKMSDSKGTLRVTLAAGLNLSENVTEGEIIRGVLKLHAENEQLKLKVQDFEKKETETKAALELKEKADLVNKAVELKKITAVQKPAYLKLELSDLKTIFDGMPEPKDLSNLGGDKGEDPKAPDGAGKMSFTELSAKHPDYLAQLKLNDKERYAQLFKNEYGVEPKNV